MHRHDFSLDRKLSHTLALTVASAILTLALSLSAYAQTETVIYNFAAGHDGHTPQAGVVFDAAGNLYGTTIIGGTHNFGTVFELSPVAGGGWTETVIHAFTGGFDGGDPFAALTLDAAGNLYGITEVGGTHDNGTVFEFSPVSGGGWHETVLHSFTGGLDGQDPLGSLVFDAAGNLYGTAANGGAHGHGNIFELSPTSSGPWSETVLHSFTGGTDGGDPVSNLVFDAAGNLYGTTEGGGIAADCSFAGRNGCGVVFELSPVSGGWHETVIHAFHGTDGAFPLAGLAFDAAGNLYGNTFEGGTLTDCPTYYGCGVVFELSPVAGGGWHESVIHAFTGSSDGAIPVATPAVDSLGNVYGTAELGGDTTVNGCNPNGCGVVFEYSPASGGGWTQTILHPFAPVPDGSIPSSTPVFDSSGNLYGTTRGAGAFGQGTVFEITP
jgi:uncharacterized repeat protein (TIGR03803 family)